MNQGKIIVGIAVLLGICAGLAGYWWNYRVGHRAIEFWGQETARLVRLAPKVEYLAIIPAGSPDAPDVRTTLGMVKAGSELCMLLRQDDLSQARGLIHLRNAILSDDQYDWGSTEGSEVEVRHALRFTDNDGKTATLFFDMENRVAFGSRNEEDVTLNHTFTKALKEFLARELPRAEQDAGEKPSTAKPKSNPTDPAKSE